MQYLFKQFQIAMTLNLNFWDTIAIIIVFDSLQKDFDIITANLLESNDKMIDQIQSILQFKKAKNINKQSMGDIKNLAITFKDSAVAFKQKTNSNNECYNYYKFCHFERNFFFLNKR